MNQSLRFIPAFLFLILSAGASIEPGKLSKDDQQALLIGQAVLKLDELAGAGAALMSPEQQMELERNVKFLSETKANRMTWAWLEFRLKADEQLRLDGNPEAKAIKQRLDLLRKLLRKYFVLE